MKLRCHIFLAVLFTVFLFNGCSKTEDLYLSEIEEILASSDLDLLQKTISKPYTNQKYEPGVVGGTWNDTIVTEPKTFNHVIASLDGSSSGIINKTVTALLSYDPYKKEWEPLLADYEIEVDKENQTLTIHYTVKDTAYWTYLDSDEKYPVTSDDFVFWYNEIEADPAFGISNYNQQCTTLPDGEQKHIDCIKIDNRRFDFVFPKIVADPMLSTNMTPCPSFIYKPAKEKGGTEAVKKIFGINTDPKKIPSCGMWHISSYEPSRRLIFVRNPDYIEKDENGISIPYYEKLICQIVGDHNTDYLLFKQGKTEQYSPRPEELADVINNQKNDYTVYNAEGSLGANLWSFNQNPKNNDKPYYKWFCKKEFRQAMSCLLNRERIINQTYRGLAESKLSIFAEANPYYDEKITLKYTYDIQKAEKLLKKAGFHWENGICYDEENNKVEFDITINSGVSTVNDICQIITDECKKLGITVNTRQTDFQKVVEMLTSTFDWQTVIIGLGVNSFPTQGSNVWPSTGALHLWNPSQETPATEWEARIDQLYDKGSYTIEKAEAKKIWDEYQTILLEQCPVIYLTRAKNFFAIRNKWDLRNVYFDNINGATLEHTFLAAN